jgi:hypothetical protein
MSVFFALYADENQSDRAVGNFAGINWNKRVKILGGRANITIRNPGYKPRCGVKKNEQEASNKTSKEQRNRGHH